MDNGNALREQIRAFILKQFPIAKKRMATDESPLLDSGIIDSLGMLDVVAFLEETFKVSVEDEDLTPENFADIRSLVSFVREKREPSSQGARSRG